MKELEYPFDSELILQKKKSLKKALLADGSKRIQKKIAVLGGSTTSHIVNILELFLLDRGIEPVFYESEYAQYYQDAMFPDDTLLAFQPDIVFFHTSNRNLTMLPEMTDSEEAVNAKLDQELSKFRAMWDSVSEKFCCPIIQNNMELPMYRLLGSRDAYDYRGRENFITRFNQGIYDYAKTHESFFVHDLCYVSADYGLAKWHNPLYWNMYKYCLCMEAIPDYSFSVAKIIKSIFGKNKKAIALDLDNTLWGGVVGDDGVDGIEIGQETGVAQSYYEFQSYLKQVKGTGVLLTVCSKNEHDNAIAGLNHPEGALKPDDFIVIKANWDPKDRNIVQTAQELSIFPDAIVFADDNPAEREIVRRQVPGVSVPEMDAVENYIRNLDRSGFFEVTNFSADDLKRNEMYQQNMERAAQMAAFSDYSEYLKSLEMEAVIDDFLPVYIARITQLTNKSNQFNVTTKRYTPDEMQAVFESDSYIRLYGKLIDKFGDNGVVSVVIGKKDGDTLDMDLWLMSCRVLKRDMELAMLDTLVEKCRKAGIKTIRGHYYPTAKNKMVRGLYESFGFTMLSEDEAGNTSWTLCVEGYENQNHVISVHGNEE